MLEQIIAILGWITACSGIVFWFVLFFTSTLEGERRAAVLSVSGLLLWIASFAFLLLNQFPSKIWIVLFVECALVLILMLLLLPIGRITSLSIQGTQRRIDERDAIFHRFYRLKPGSEEFKAYYQEHPEKKRADQKIRKSPELGGPGSASYHPLNSLYQIAEFDVMERCSRDLEWKPETKKVEVESRDITQRLKGFAKYLGADLAGVTVLNPAHIYSHIGRSPGKWGAAVELNHSYAIAIGCEMDYSMIRHAPELPVTTETAFQYFEVGKVAMMLARYINYLGYEARAHVDGNYRVLCVPIAADAGLGELGRLGLLISPKYGPRLRLSVVTTTLPLIPDTPVQFGVQEFCEICKKCADSCPSASIEKDRKKSVHGVEKWQSQQESCYAYWRHQGTDCSLCIRVCPYSHPDKTLHNTVRWAIRRNSIARKLALAGDDLLYGRKPRGAFRAPYWHK